MANASEPRSQLTLEFHDPTYEQVVAIVTLKSSAQLNYESASRPRFDWSHPDYEINLTELTGEIDVMIAEDLPRAIELKIQTHQNVEIWLDSGHYVIDATNSQVSVLNRAGSAIVIAPNRATTSSVPVGYRDVFDLQAGVFTRLPELTNLLQNSTLDASLEDGALQIANWDCSVGVNENATDNSLVGQNLPEPSPLGWKGLRMTRGPGALDSGFNRCTQTLGEGDLGLDVSQYDYLSFEVKLYVNEQSLSRCGEKASECPLMLDLYYWSQGTDFHWYHGIYARNDPGSNYVVRCDSCFENHVFVNDKTLYTYESGNLLVLIPTTIPPQAFIYVSFYASGHDYDVYVSEVSLFASTSSAPDLALNESS